MALTNAQKSALATLLISQAGTMIEFATELIHDRDSSGTLADVPTEVLAAQLTVWLKDLPGDAWSTFLPDRGMAKRILASHA